MKKKYTKQISLGINPITGRRIRKRIYADSPTLLRQAEKQAIIDFEKNGNLASTAFSVFADKWFDTYCSKLTFNTTAGYKNAYKKCSDLYNMQMQDITRSDLQAILNDNWDKPTTCKKIKVFFNLIFQSAVIDNVISRNPATALKIPRAKSKAASDNKSSRRPFTAEEIEAIKAAPLDPMQRLLTDILYQFGLRPSEAFALNYEDFDLENKVLTVNKAMGYGEHEVPFIKSTKTYVTRVLPIPDEFIESFRKYKGKGHIFLNNEGKFMHKSQADKFGKKVCDAINVQMGGDAENRKTDISMYSFRHNKASQLYYISGISTKAKAEYMGHSEEIFIRTYSHLIKEKEDLSALSKMT